MNTAIILLAGSGTRLQSSENKVFLPLGFKKVIDYSVEAMILCDIIDQIVLVYAPSDKIKAEKLIVDYQQRKMIFAILAGYTTTICLQCSLISQGNDY